MKTNYNNNKGRGFSLVEMLVVISVIGIIAAIAVPNIGNITGNADTSAAKRNAQTAASLYAGAISAGAEFSATNKSGILDELALGKDGIDVGGSRFQMMSLEEDEKNQVMEYLQFDQVTETLSYLPEGGAPDEGEAEFEPDDTWSSENWSGMASVDANSYFELIVDANSGYEFHLRQDELVPSGGGTDLYNWTLFYRQL